jgi:hypothetical protein
LNYKAAWRIKHKIMQAMTEREAPRRLSGFVQIDDAYLGGERNGGKPGRGSENKQAFLIAVETEPGAPGACRHRARTPLRRRQHPGLAGASSGARGQGLQRRLVLLSPLCRRRACPYRAGSRRRSAREVRGARWVNVLLGNVKRAISGSHHAIRQGKYARRYLAKAAYRFNRRFHLPESVPRLLRAMALCAPSPEPLLRQATNFSS